jgi:hypothetical protein
VIVSTVAVAEATEVVGTETVVDLDPFAKVMVVVVADSLLALRVVEVTSTPPITVTWQLAGSSGTVLLFSTVKVQTPLAKEHDTLCPNTNPSNDGPPPKMTPLMLLVLTVVELTPNVTALVLLMLLVPTAVDLSPRSAGKTVIASKPTPRAAITAMAAATPISFLNSDISFHAPCAGKAGGLTFLRFRNG